MTTEVPAASSLDRLASELDQDVDWHILLVEDDDGDAAARPRAAGRRPAGGPRRAGDQPGRRPASRARHVDCVLLDMGLPDAEGIPGVEAPRRRGAATPRSSCSPGAASERLGVRAVAAGAQDYLVKGRVDDQLLARSIRYAIERQRAARLTRDLFAAERRRADNTRMERALIPTPLLRSSDVSVAVRYRAGREDAELGGDFYDTVESPDGTVTVLIGDVAGHGPDAAALGARLRSAWRALTLAGLAADRRARPTSTSSCAPRSTRSRSPPSPCSRSPATAESGRLLLAGHPPAVSWSVPPRPVVGDGGLRAPARRHGRTRRGRRSRSPWARAPGCCSTPTG